MEESVSIVAAAAGAALLGAALTAAGGVPASSHCCLRWGSDVRAASESPAASGQSKSLVRGLAAHPANEVAPLAPPEESDDIMPWAVGGVGGAYLLARPGDLKIEVFKRDLNARSWRTDLSAILAGPDRLVVDEAVIPHLGGRAGDPPGPVQRVRLGTRVERPGIYALNITTKNDRYGLNLAWGMRTNAAAYVIETARGHRDEAHQEPIVLLDPERPADVSFLPRRGPFEIEVEGLPIDVAELTLYDEHDSVVASIPVAGERSTNIRDYLRVPAPTRPEGSVKYLVAAGEERGTQPWRLHFPRGEAFVSIDGLTRWEAGDRYRDHCVWTPDPASWFAFLEYRWLITPYQRTVWLAPGTEGMMGFLVHNNAPAERTVSLALECPALPTPSPSPGTRIWLPLVSRPGDLREPPASTGTGGPSLADSSSGNRASRPRDDLAEAMRHKVSSRSGRSQAPRGVSFADSRPPARLSTNSVTLAAGEAREAAVSFRAPLTGELVCHIEASPLENPEIATYATLRVLAGDSPAHRPLDLPFVLKPYAHENRQLGYLPDYPVDNELYFDRQNRPYVVTPRRLYRRLAGEWLVTDIGRAVVARVPEGPLGTWAALTTKVAFDRDNDVYLLGRSGSSVALLHSRDAGATFTAYVLPGREDEPRSWDLEQFSGHNVPEGPPPVVRLTRTSREVDPAWRWRSVNDLDLFVGTKAPDGHIDIAAPVRLTDSALGFSMHSGIPSSVVSRGSLVHVVWGEATDPATSRDEIPGVPVYVATYDRVTGTASPPVFLAHGAPPNDSHNTPGITMDGQGYLHVVVGTHGQPFLYLRSLEPNDAMAWTAPVQTSDTNPRQTYVGLVSGADGTLHLAFRQWRSGEEYLDGATWAALAYQRKPPDGGWSEPRVLVAPPLSEYSIYYHRLTIDRDGALFLSYDYWSTMWYYRNDQRGAVAAASGRPGTGWGRAVLHSADGGDTWSFW